ncbi:MAG: tripartite tricarboxylate transporter substrate binding protein, partial [Lysobacteraceae bacterium]
MTTRRTLLTRLLAASALPAFGASPLQALAQSAPAFPSRPITIVVGFPPGGG